MIRKHWRKILAGAALAFALIVLPTGTPEDIPTTFLIIALGGWKLYLILAAIAIALLCFCRR